LPQATHSLPIEDAPIGVRGAVVDKGRVYGIGEQDLTGE